MENWTPVMGYESYYEISDMGRCRRIKRGKKLTPERVYEIRWAIANGGTLKDTAKACGVSHVTVAMIRDGITWNGDANFRYIKPHERSDFYFNFCLCIHGKYRQYAAHRAVWEAFHGKIPASLEINHKNLDRSDNRLINLELLSRADNIKHAVTIYEAESGTHNSGGRYYARKKALKEKRAAKKSHIGNPENIENPLPPRETSA